MSSRPGPRSFGCRLLEFGKSPNSMRAGYAQAPVFVPHGFSLPAWNPPCGVTNGRQSIFVVRYAWAGCPGFVSLAARQVACRGVFYLPARTGAHAPPARFACGKKCRRAKHPSAGLLRRESASADLEKVCESMHVAHALLLAAGFFDYGCLGR